MMPNMNPRQMQKMMSKLGMKQEDIPATEVIIKCPDKEIIIKNPHVTKVEVMGQETFQVSGEVSEGKGIGRDDVLTVAERANVSEDEARLALKESGGDLAEAIMSFKK